jgi:hypothetical protein
MTVVARAAVEVPSTGDVVKLFRYDVNNTAWQFGRLPSSALIPLHSAAAAGSPPQVPSSSSSVPPP